MNPLESPEPGRRWTAAELRKLPAEQRTAILAAQAARAEAEYRNDPELTAFEAFGPDDLLTEDQKAELDRRLESLDANPNDVVTWESIIAYVRRKR